MVVAAHDGGGGGGNGFPGKDNYDSGDITQGGGNVSGGPHAQSALEQGGRLALNALPGGTIISGIMSFGGGAADEVAKALKPTDPSMLIDQASKWGHVSTKAYDYRDQVQNVMSKLANWQGDDADKAREVLQGLYATFHTVGNTSSAMNTTVGNMGATLKWARDNYGDGGGFTDGVEDTFTGGGASDEAANAYQQLITNFNENMGNMPTSVPSEVKPGAASPTFQAPPTNNPVAPVSGAPHAGGAGGAPHVGNPVAPHIPNAPIPDGDPTPPRNDDPPTDGPGDPPRFDPPSTGGGSTYDPSSIGSTGSGYTGGGGGLGSPGLDTSGSLAGYDPSAAGGGAGAGSLGGAPGSGSGAGAPGGGVPGGGAGLGAGGGVGAGGGGGGVVGGGAGGRGGMMPMHGGQNNDDDERERSTWLNEEDDVWGAEENLPGVIH